MFFANMLNNDYLGVIVQLIIAIFFIYVFERAYNRNTNWYQKKIDRIFILLNKVSMAYAVLYFAKPRLPSTEISAESVSQELSIMYFVVTIFILVWLYYYIKVAFVIIFMAFHYKYMNNSNFRIYLNKLKSDKIRKNIKRLIEVSEEDVSK